MRLCHRVFQACTVITCLLSQTLHADSLNEIFPSMILLGVTGQCPFSVTGGPQQTASLRIDAYADSNPGCSVVNGQFWFLGTSSHTPITLPSGTYSFSNNPKGQTNLCNQVPTARSFTISQVNSSDNIVSTSTCFIFTCSSNQITCTQTGTLALVNAS